MRNHITVIMYLYELYTLLHYHKTNSQQNDSKVDSTWLDELWNTSTWSMCSFQAQHVNSLILTAYDCSVWWTCSNGLWSLLRLLYFKTSCAGGCHNMSPPLQRKRAAAALSQPGRAGPDEPIRTIPASRLAARMYATDVRQTGVRRASSPNAPA